MAQARQRAGFWRSVRDLPGRTPLRVKLITAVLALVAIALVVISVAGIAVLRNDLLGPIDDELTGSFGNAVSAVAQLPADRDRRGQAGRRAVLDRWQRGHPRRDHPAPPSTAAR